MTDFEQALITVREVYVHLPKRYEEVQKEIKQLELELEDLEHVIELAPLSAYKGFQMAKEVKAARQKRRQLKNEMEQLEIIKRLQAVGKPSEKSLNQAIGDVRRINKIQGNRCYSMRVRHDLQELVK